jgi:hypothetical protein
MNFEEQKGTDWKESGIICQHPSFAGSPAAASATWSLWIKSQLGWILKTSHAKNILLFAQDICMNDRLKSEE